MVRRNDLGDLDLGETAAAANTAAIHLLRGLRAADRTSGLSAARLSALSVVVFGGPTPIGRLARVEGVSSPTMTRLVDGLEGLGLVDRRPHPDGGRIVLVAATEAGTRLMHAARHRRVEAIATAMNALEPAERDALVAAADPWGRVAARVGDVVADLLPGWPSLLEEHGPATRVESPSSAASSRSGGGTSSSTGPA